MLGLVVNPVAGIGGAVGLKGSDGRKIIAEARLRGGVSAAADRAAVALKAFGTSVGVVTAGGAMGATVCEGLGLRHHAVLVPRRDTAVADTRAADTRAAVRACIAAGAELILFAGGDGTARDVAGQAGATPILGIPAGVKMYSGVFAASPALAGRLAAQFLATPPALRRTTEADLLDIDEDAVRRDEVAIRFHGTVCVPRSPAVPFAKASVPPDDDGRIEALCRDLAAELEPDCLYVVGPGRTAGAFLSACGCPGTLLGVDVMRNGVLLAADASERRILALLADRPVRLVVGLVGGQGCLFGRGNQQISRHVLRQVARERILVLASASKVASLPHGLFVDTGEAALDASLAGFIRIATGPRRSTLLRVRPGC